jgi:hypothetical protein
LRSIGPPDHELSKRSYFTRANEQSLVAAPTSPLYSARSAAKPNLCGRSVRICKYPQGNGTALDRAATIGGLLNIRGQGLCMLISTHAVLGAIFGGDEDSRETDSGGNSDSDREDSSDGSAASQAWSEIYDILSRDPLSVTLQTPADNERRGVVEFRSSEVKTSEPQYLGTVLADVSRQDREKYYSLDHDWALVPVDVPGMFSALNEIKWSGGVVCPRIVPDYNLKSPVEVLILTCHPGVTLGRFTGTKSMIMLPWTGLFAEAYVIDCQTGLYKSLSVFHVR